MPELRLVVLALQDKLAYGINFQSALAALFGGEASSLTATESLQKPTAPVSSSPATLQQAGQSSAALQPDRDALIAEASRNFEDYQRLTAAGKLAEAGQKLEALKSDLMRLSARTR